MRRLATGATCRFAALVAVPLALTRPVAAAEPYCSDAAAHADPDKVPANLVAAVARTFQIDEAAARGAAVVRCVGRRLLGCYVGANLNCDKADKRRALPVVTAWCRENPGSKDIPMSATGHATIYEWSCRGRRAAAGKALLSVDQQGYVAENWKQIR